MRDVRAAWKVRCKDASPTASDMLLYCILRAIRSRSNDKQTVVQGLICKSFTPITNSHKLKSGMAAWSGVQNAVYRLAASGSVHPLMECIETEAEAVLYRELMFQLLRTKIKFYDPRLICFIVRQDQPPIQQIINLIHAGMVMVRRSAGRGNIGRRKAMRERAVARITPPIPRFNLTGTKMILLAAEDLADLQDKAAFLEKNHIRVGISDDAVVYSMPERASIIVRRELLKGFEPLSVEGFDNTHNSGSLLGYVRDIVVVEQDHG